MSRALAPEAQTRPFLTPEVARRRGQTTATPILSGAGHNQRNQSDRREYCSQDVGVFPLISKLSPIFLALLSRPAALHQIGGKNSRQNDSDSGP